MSLAFSLVALSAPAQAPQPDKSAEDLGALVQEVQAQQKQIAANQVNIDEKLLTLAEAIRVARIYSSRGGR